MRSSTDILNIPLVRLHHNVSLRVFVLFALDLLLIPLSFIVAHFTRFGELPIDSSSLIYLPVSALVIILSNFIFFQYDPLSLNMNTGIHYRSFLIFPFNLLAIAAVAFIVGPYHYEGSVWGRGMVFLYAGSYALSSFYLRKFFYKKLQADRLLSLSTLKGESELLMAQKRMRGERLISESRYMQDFNFKVPISEINAKWVLNLELENFKIYDKISRFRDISISLIGLLLTAPIIILSCFLIYLEDRKNPLFKQKRRGLYGKSFSILKLRTMTVCTGQYTNHFFSSPGDARITKVGLFLRKSRIDEIPQLINVLVGDMSLIGPRPEREEILEEIRSEFVMADFRTMIRPGVSGWAQVKLGYCSDKNEILEKFEYDAYYLTHRGFVLDLLIILKTIRTILWGQGL